MRPLNELNRLYISILSYAELIKSILFCSESVIQKTSSMFSTGHGTLVMRQRRAIRPIQAPRSPNHFHALRVDQVFGAEQNSALMSG